ncbi:MAG: Fic family protein [Nocardioides sp.]
MTRDPAQHAVALPAHRSALEPWRQTVRGGTREDRTLAEITVSLPPHIADLAPAIPSSVAAASDDALRKIATLDATEGHHLASLSTLLVRAESVASSKIERIEASVDEFARALHGNRSNPAATSMVASASALIELVDSVNSGGVNGGGSLTVGSLHRAHALLMADDPREVTFAGRPRNMQNWIDGSDHSPRGAVYIPPPARTLASYLDDLVAFANRNDIGVLTQAAIVHAQFESIHAYTDGNGRIGRALINTILRRRGVTRRVVIPLASAIVARRQDYFDALDSYRAGDVGPLLASFARGAAIAAEEAGTTARRLAEMPSQWRSAAMNPRGGSAASALIDTLLDDPVFTAEDVEGRLERPSSSAYAAISRLHDAGVIRPLTQRAARRQVWVTCALSDELDDLGVRIATRARAET